MFQCCLLLTLFYCTFAEEVLIVHYWKPFVYFGIIHIKRLGLLYSLQIIHLHALRSSGSLLKTRYLSCADHSEIENFSYDGLISNPYLDFPALIKDLLTCKVGVVAYRSTESVALTFSACRRSSIWDVVIDSRRKKCRLFCLSAFLSALILT